MTPAHLWFYAFLAASTLLIIALAAYSDLARELREERRENARMRARAEAAVEAAARDMGRLHVHPSQRGLRVVEGGA